MTFLEIRMKFKYFTSISRIGWIRLMDDDLVEAERVAVCVQLGQRCELCSMGFGESAGGGDFND